MASQYTGPQAIVGYTANNWVCALTVLRLVGPLQACGIRLIEGNDEAGIHPERVSLADAVLIQRDFPRNRDAYERIIDRARSEGKPVILDIDDLIFELPHDHPDSLTGFYDNALVDMLRSVVEADAVTVSSEALRSYYQSFNSNIWVLPNYLNERVWQFQPPADQQVTAPHDPVVIGYMGGDSHVRDLEYVEPVLRRLGQRYGKRIALHFYGGKPPTSLSGLFDLCPVEWTPLDPTDYGRFAGLFSQARCDIAIAPLVDTHFNRCKSPIKFLEYSALGMPGIYSQIPPYAEVVTDGVTGFLARTDDEWENRLCALIDESALRVRIGANAMADVKQKWRLSDHAEQWRAAYQHIGASMPSHHSSVAINSVKQVQVWQQHGRLQAQSAQVRSEIASLHQTLARVNEWADALLAQVGWLRPDNTDTQALLEEVTRVVTTLAANYDQADRQAAACYLQMASQFARANELGSRLTAISQYSVYQQELIRGLLNGRAMRLIIGTQTRLAGLLSGGRSPAANGFVVSPPPALLEPAAQTAEIEIPFEISREPAALLDRQFKRGLTQLYTNALANFLSLDHRLEFPVHESPAVTIIIPMHNRAELTLQCLRSIKDSIRDSYEIIVVDDMSTDGTQDLLQHVNGIQVLTNTENLHFLKSSNCAAAVARGDFLLFLNNDVQLLPGAIDAALMTMRSAPAGDIGAVGAKIILLDGTLQEAGSIVWNDGSCQGYGRGDDPTAAPYMFSRDVDYCSGAFLLTPRALFHQHGGFDEHFAPAYYEDSDYCLSLRDIGKRVVYTPHSVVLHYETASYQDSQTSSVTQLQKRHRVILLNKHAEQLTGHYPPGDKALELLARFGAGEHKKRILYIDDRVPHVSQGAGFPRARDLLLALIENGYQVTLYPLTVPSEAWDSVYQEMPDTVEVMIDYGVDKLESFLEQRWRYYDTILISRPHNARCFRQILERRPEWFTHTRLIYDAEAIYTLREATRRRLLGEPVAEDELAAQVNEEVNLARGADAVLCVSESERAPFIDAGFKHVHVLGHTIRVNPTTNGFQDRCGILFVGAIQDDNAPNADAVCWFAREIFLHVRQQLGADVTFTIVGHNGSEKVRGLSGLDGIRFAGCVDDLIPYYNQARIFVAPTRFAAGLPMKVHQAAAHGIPIVCTSLLASEVGWQHEVEVLVGDDAATFAAQCVRLHAEQALWETLRSSALRRVERECSPESFRAVVKSVLS
ncbi:MAG: glycosyltransferase [Chloroflexi bacterium]|nr:glycosyltransferase [Chloroflexota bacterium]